MLMSQSGVPSLTFTIYGDAFTLKRILEVTGRAPQEPCFYMARLAGSPKLD